VAALSGSRWLLLVYDIDARPGADCAPYLILAHQKKRLSGKLLMESELAVSKCCVHCTTAKWPGLEGRGFSHKLIVRQGVLFPYSESQYYRLESVTVVVRREDADRFPSGGSAVIDQRELPREPGCLFWSETRKHVTCIDLD